MDAMTALASAPRPPRKLTRQRGQGGRAASAAGVVTATFAETEPLSTYLFSFVVGDFKVETATRRGRTFRMFHRETDAAK
jgi:aminopeptidase N